MMMSKTTSDDAAAISIEQAVASGTIAHRYLAVRPSEMEAFERAIQKTEKIALLVDLVDSYRGIDNAISLKKKYRDSGKSIAMRLDS
jgi:nicotinic acid phosphoribosyltransferase